MTTRKFKLTTPHYNCLLEVGSWKVLPHYSAIGSPVEFYLWRRESKAEDGSSTEWLRGRDATEALDTLKKARIEGKAAFIEAFDKLYAANRKGK